MTTELAQDHAIALQLHGVLTEIDPVRWRDEMASRLKARLAEIQQQIEPRADQPRLGAVAHALRTGLPELDQASPDLKTRWLEFKQRVQPVYATMAASLKRERIHVPSLRPTNYARNLLHVSSALAGLIIIELIHNPLVVLGIAVAWAVAAWTMETSRRHIPAVNRVLMGVLGPVAHAHETHRVNSATWYATALVLLAATQSPMLCAIAVMVLGVADPMAALVGRRFGRVKLLHGRSLEGTLGFFFSAAAVSFAVLRVFHAGSLGLVPALVVAGSAALAGALTELFSFRIDDNFSIPLSAAAGGAVALWAMGLPIL
jgi:dolichol kinase